MTQVPEPEPFNIRVGIDRVKTQEVFHPGYRTVEQFEVIRGLASRPNLAYFCGGNFFDPGNSGSHYQGPFTALWCDTDDHLHGTRIGKRGRILHEVTDRQVTKV